MKKTNRDYLYIYISMILLLYILKVNLYLMYKTVVICYLLYYN
jgi:hypothetical protein